MKKYVILLTFCALLVPFILIKTIFPFYRFGMFAEPVTTQNQAEHFEILYQKQTKKYILKASTVNMPSQPVYRLLLRNYYYRGEIIPFLKEMNRRLKIYHNLQAERLQFVQISPNSDTLVIETLIP